MSSLGIESTKTFLAHRLFSPWAGFAFGDWMRLWRQSGHVSPAYIPRAAFISLMTTVSSFERWRENKRFAHRLNRVDIPPPLFVLGHWRSGTTHLHHLLALDPRFSAPTMEEVVFPHAVLSGGRATYFMELFMPKTRGVDAMPLGSDLPFEDEFAIAMISGLSPYLGWAFPSHREFHERSLLLDDPKDAERWKSAFAQFAGKLAIKHEKPAIFKSPPHTARIRHLVDLFPNARFVHIHRDPETVFRSTCHLVARGIQGLRLERPRGLNVEEEVIRRYRVLYQRYWDDRPLVDGRRFVEVSYEDLDRKPLDVLRGIYDRLGLGDFREQEARVTKYLGSVENFPKNNHPPMTAPWRRRLIEEWGPIFHRWNYALEA